jgi:antitoxin component of MazEF toxin-antitoxin module
MKPRVVKAFKHGDSIVMSIPAPFAEELKIGAGDLLLVSIKGHRLYIEKTIPPILEQKKERDVD